MVITEVNKKKLVVAVLKKDGAKGVDLVIDLNAAKIPNTEVNMLGLICLDLKEYK